MRERDENGVLPPLAHLRLPNVPALQQAALFEIAKDPRELALPVKRKLALIDKAIDHVVDGVDVPKWIYAKDEDRPENHFLVEIWRMTCDAVRAQRVAS